MYLLGLAGLWEITFAIWLIIYGGQSAKNNDPLTAVWQNGGFSVILNIWFSNEV
jgi:hypothetical protein